MVYLIAICNTEVMHGIGVVIHVSGHGHFKLMG